MHTSFPHPDGTDKGSPSFSDFFSYFEQSAFIICMTINQNPYKTENGAVKSRFRFLFYHKVTFEIL